MRPLIALLAALAAASGLWADSEALVSCYRPRASRPIYVVPRGYRFGPSIPTIVRPGTSYYYRPSPIRATNNRARLAGRSWRRDVAIRAAAKDRFDKALEEAKRGGLR